MSKTVPGVLGVFSHMDTLIDAIKHCKGNGKDDLRVYSPCPRHEIEEVLDEGVSPVRRFTLLGALLGATTGYLFTSFTSMDWVLPTSGKPVVSLVAFTVIAFELTILFGSIFTLIGIVLNAKLFRKRTYIYDDRFTQDKFGIFIPCGPTEMEQYSRLLKEQGAEEVKRAE